MNIKEASELVKLLRKDINKGIDVESNKEWIVFLGKEISIAIDKGYEKAISEYSELITTTKY